MSTQKRINNLSMYDKLTAAEKAQIVEWLRKHFEPSKTSVRTSYGLKHVFHDDGGFYTYQSQFAAAMIEAGFTEHCPKWFAMHDEHGDLYSHLFKMKLTKAGREMTRRLYAL